MRRGFKAQAERLSLTARAEIGLGASDRLNPKEFLVGQGYLIWKPEEIPGLSKDHIDQLIVSDPDSWSGLTIREPDCTAIIYNSAHSPERTASTLMHEWAHLELRHKPNRVDRSEHGILLLSDYPAELEEEANWLSAAMLMPRDGVLHYRARGLDISALASHFGTSVDLARWRVRTTGVDRQLSNRSY